MSNTVSGCNLQLEEVFQHAHALLGGEGLRVKLDAPDGEFFVGEPHDLALFSLGGNFETIRQARTLDKKRVVARGLHRIGQAFENIGVAVLHGAGLAMHETISANDLASEVLPNALMPEADAEERLLSGKGLDHGEADACLVGRTGTGRDHHTIWIEREGFLHRDGIVAKDLLLHPKLPEILDEIIGERVEVIDNEKHDGKAVV